MRATLALLVVLVLALPTLAVHASPASEGAFLAGAAKADITPPVGTPLFAYTARHALLATGEDLQKGAKPRFVDQRDDAVDTELYGKTFLKSEGVHTRLYAQAFVLDDGEKVVGIVLADLGAIPGELHQAVAARLAAAGVPIPEERLLLGGTHTHGGPGGFFQYAGYALLGGDAFDPRLFGALADGIAGALVAAYEAREPATLAVGEALVPDATRNRALAEHLTEHAHDGEHADRTARLFRIDAADGRPMGVITIFAAHGTIVGAGDLLITGDNQGIAARMLARGIAAASGQRETDVVVAGLNGALGDVSPVGSGDGFFERVEDAGRRQAEPMLAAWAALEGKGTRDVSLDARFRFLCFCGQEVQAGERISVVPILGVGGGTRFPAPLGIPGHGGKVPLVVGAPGAVPNIVRLQALRINDHVLVAMPGEASVALGDAIERDVLALAASGRAVASVDLVGVANDYISYMSTLGEYDAQGYEGSFNLYGRMTGPLFRRELVALSRALLDGEAVARGHDGALEHPPTGTPSAPPIALAPSAAPAALAEPAPLAPGGVARFAWLGGAPGVEHPAGVAMVEVREANTGALVHDDLGYELRVRHAKRGLDEHVWSAEWAWRADVPAGEYRFEVRGLRVGPAGVEPYALASGPFSKT